MQRRDVQEPGSVASGTVRSDTDLWGTAHRDAVLIASRHFFFERTTPKQPRWCTNLIFTQHAGPTGLHLTIRRIQSR